MEILSKYFPTLSEAQVEQFRRLAPLYREWNAKINVISRKDIDNLYERHVLHSLAIARVIQFLPSSEVLDLGTGGGFPGIPLAILFPKVRFHLIDGTGKKIRVVQEIAQAVGLRNVVAEQKRAEELKRQFDFVVTRAVADLDQLAMWSRRLLKRKHRHALPNGILALKGGNVEREVKALPKGEYAETFPIRDFFDEPFFAEKVVVYVQG